jgi:polyhydroxyalkanoate synthesis regulator protein
MSEPRIIKKYPNRRLYDTEESRYITLADVRRLSSAIAGEEARIRSILTRTDETRCSARCAARPPRARG